MQEIEAFHDQLRTADEVAKRCLVLYAVVGAGYEEARKDELITWLQQENLLHAVSHEEISFLRAKISTRQQRINATWRAEALIPLLWALGKIDHLPSLATKCDPLLVSAALPPLLEPVANFLANAKIRSDEEISDVYEEIYQAHWLVRDAQIHNKPVPNGYDAGVIQERHYALNWLTGYSGQEWDDITTDT